MHREMSKAARLLASALVIAGVITGVTALPESGRGPGRSGYQAGPPATGLVVSDDGLLRPASACLAASPPQKAEVVVDVVYLIDISGSIIGLGQSQGDLLPTLIDALSAEIYRTKAGSTLSIATFGDGLQDVDGPGGTYEAMRRFEVDPADLAGSRQRIVDYIRGLDQTVRRPGGYSEWTAVYDSAREVIQELDRFKADWENLHPGSSYADHRIQKLVIFTDGLDNHSKLWGKQDFENEVAARSDHLFVKVVTAPGVQFPSLSGIPIETGFDTRSVEVIPLPRSLNFGNIRGLGPGGRATATMKLVAQRPIPSSRIDFSYTFPGLPDGALEVSLNPDVVDGDPTQVVMEVSLEVVDKEALDGAAVASGSTSFGGTLTLSGANPKVSLLPAQTALVFSYEPVGRIEVRPISRDVGVFQGLRRPTASDASARVSYLLSFDQQATQTGVALRAQFEWAAGNPADLEALAAEHRLPPLVSFSWEPGGPASPQPGPVTLHPTAESLTVTLTLPKELDPELPTGDYSGRLVFTASGAAAVFYTGGPGGVAGGGTGGTGTGGGATSGPATGPGGVTGSGSSRLELPLRAHVPRPPWPWWARLSAAAALAAAAVAAALLAYRLTLPRFRPGQELVVTYPDGRPVRYELDEYAQRDPWRADRVQLAPHPSELNLRIEDDLGSLRAARGGKAVLEPNPYTLEKFAATPQRLTLRGEALTSAGPVPVEHGDTLRFGGTQVIFSLKPDEDAGE